MLFFFWRLYALTLCARSITASFISSFSLSKRWTFLSHSSHHSPGSSAIPSVLVLFLPLFLRILFSQLISYVRQTIIYILLINLILVNFFKIFFYFTLIFLYIIYSLFQVVLSEFHTPLWLIHFAFQTFDLFHSYFWIATNYFCWVLPLFLKFIFKDLFD